MEYIIYRCGAAIGTLNIAEDGLYRVLLARIPLCHEILRLYLDGAPFGVFLPTGDMLECRRRISRTQLPALPTFVSAWCEADGQWSEEINGCRHRNTPTRLERAVRWREDAPMAFPDAPEKLHLMELDGALYLCCLCPYSAQ